VRQFLHQMVCCLFLQLLEMHQKHQNILKHIVFRKEINEESNTARYGTKSFFPGGDLLGSIVNPDNAPLIDPNKPMDEVMPKINASYIILQCWY
jgi:hypothetical protein